MAIKKCRLLVKIGNVIKRCYLRHNNVDKILILDDSLIEKVTLTIEPSEQDALVRFYIDGVMYPGNSIAVVPGTTVRYIVTKYAFEKTDETITVNTNTTVPVTMELALYELDITDYEYTNINYHLKLNKYIGVGADVIVPNISEE